MEADLVVLDLQVAQDLQVVPDLQLVALVVLHLQKHPAFRQLPWPLLWELLR